MGPTTQPNIGITETPEVLLQT